MTNTERQLITDLVEKAQAVIDSIDPSEVVDALDEDTTYEVNANAVWDLSNALEIVEQDLGIGASDEPSHPTDQESVRNQYYQEYLERKRSDCNA